MSSLKYLFCFWIAGIGTAFGQLTLSPHEHIARLNLQGGLPEKLLSTRSAVFAHHSVTQKEAEEIQQTFQKSGIDAIAYFDLDMLFANADATTAFSGYLTKREIQNLVFVEKGDNGFTFTITANNGKANVIDGQQPAWTTSHQVLTEALKTIYRTTSQQKKQNLLINDTPETGDGINPIVGKRNEFYASDLKVDLLAVPKTGNEAIDRELEEIFQNNYPLKFKMTEPGIAEKDLRRQGFLYVLGSMHTRGEIIKQLLGYDMKKAETAYVSVVLRDGHQQLKTIRADVPVFKFYFKHIDSGNVFLGTKWDADTEWQEALLNHILAMKAELRIN